MKTEIWNTWLTLSLPLRRRSLRDIKKDSPKYFVINGIFKLTELRNMNRFFLTTFWGLKSSVFFFNLRVTFVWNTWEKRGFLSVSVCWHHAGHVRKPLCLRKIKETVYFYIFILTSTFFAGFNPTIRAFKYQNICQRSQGFSACFRAAPSGYYQTDMYFSKASL